MGSRTDSGCADDTWRSARDLRRARPPLIIRVLSLLERLLEDVFAHELIHRCLIMLVTAVPQHRGLFAAVAREYSRNLRRLRHGCGRGGVLKLGEVKGGLCVCGGSLGRMGGSAGGVGLPAPLLLLYTSAAAAQAQQKDELPGPMLTVQCDIICVYLSSVKTPDNWRLGTSGVSCHYCAGAAH